MVAIDNPYVGPKAFERKNAPLFFGRDAEAEELLALVISERVVLFYAQSGAGKTSLINARLIPDLEKEDFEVLPVARVGAEELRTTGVDNVYAFNALCYLSGLDDKEIPRLAKISLQAFLEQNQGTAAGVSPRVLILDQFEEILTAHPDRRKEREGFFRQLRQALDADPRLSVLLAMREDHIAGLDRYAHLLPGRLRTHFRMERLRCEDAVTAIRRPAEDAGRPFAEGVAEALVDNLRQERTADQEKTTIPGEFVEPVQLQVVCFQLWDSLRGHPGKEITAPHLEAFGDVDRALESFYEDAVARVARRSGVSEMKIVRWFGKTLITSTGLRSSVHREEESTGGLPNAAVDRLETEHLIRAEHVRGGIWYELVHDRFIEPILAAHRHREQVRKRRRFRLLAAAMMAALLVAAVLLDQSRRQRREARNRANTLEVAAELTAEARRWLAVDPPTALEFASLAVWLTYWEEGTAIPEAESTLRQILHGAPARRLWKRSAEQVSALALSSDGSFLATGHDSGEVRVWDSRSGALVHELPAHADLVTDLAFGRAGTRLATLGLDNTFNNTFKVWSTAFQERPIVSGDEDFFEIFAFSTYGTRLATAATSGTVPISSTVRIWDATSGEGLGELSVSGSPDYMTFNPEGERLAMASDGALTRVWGLDSGGGWRALSQVEGYIAAFSPDGRGLATATKNHELSLWDGNAAKGSWPLPKDDGEIQDLAFGPRGAHLLTVTRQGTARTWNLTSGQNALILGLRSDGMAAFRRDGRRLATFDGKEISVWEIAFEDVPTLFSHEGSVEAVAFSPDAKRLATAGTDGVTRIWDVPSLELLLELKGHTASIKALTLSPDGRLLATASEDRTARLWDAETGSPRHPPAEHDDYVEAVAFSSDGHRLVTGGKGGKVRLWDCRSGAELAVPAHHEYAVTAAAFSPDGRRLVTADGDGIVKVWDAKTLRLENTWQGHDGQIKAMAFSAEGKILATGGFDNTAKIWNAGTGKAIHELAGHKDSVTAVVFSSDDERLVTGSVDREVIFWKVDSGESLFRLPDSSSQVHELAFSPQGEYLAVARADGKVRLEPGSLEALLSRAERGSQP